MSSDGAGRRDGLGSALTRTVPWAGLATLGLIAVFVLRNPDVALAVHVYIAMVGGLALLTLLLAVLGGTQAYDAMPWAAFRWRRRRPHPLRLRSLQEIEHAADFALSTAFDVHYRLRPHLRRIAEHRLGNRGISLEREPERAREALGSLTWEIVRPDRDPPSDRNAHGLELADLRAMVHALETL